jgi:DNA-binding transcriptional MerR regulator
MSAAAAPLWTIDELGTQAALALSVNYDGPPNGRVREVPDRRTIRYYTTLGLLDRPAEMRGRTALYGRRHLLQLVAIKRLQARGLSLAELQQQLLGLSNAALERLAKLPADLPAPGRTAARPDAGAARAEAFWSAAPAPVAEPPPAADESAGPAAPLQGVPLAADVTLLLGAARPLEPDDLEAIRVVAEPLLRLLHKRRLLGPRQPRRTP